MHLYEHAIAELTSLQKAYSGRPEDEQPVVLQFKDQILDLVDAFGRSGQSGASAPYVSSAILSCLRKLLSYDVLTPVEDAPDEWVEVTEEGATKKVFQHKRVSALFKDDEGCHYIDAVVFNEKGADGHVSSFTTNGRDGGLSSRLRVKSFPFTPKTFYVDVVRLEDDTLFPAVLSQLKDICEYYDAPAFQKFLAEPKQHLLDFDD
jgi:hypothetical protein